MARRTDRPPREWLPGVGSLLWNKHYDDLCDFFGRRGERYKVSYTRTLAEMWDIPADAHLIARIIEWYDGWETEHERSLAYETFGDKMRPPSTPSKDATMPKTHTKSSTKRTATKRTATKRTATKRTEAKRTKVSTINQLRANRFQVAERVLASQSRRVLLYGPPGTGKTHVATLSGVEPGQPVYAITLTDETPMTELRGHFVVNEGRFVWMDGIAIKAWREGARLVLNEIDHAGGDVQSFLHVVLDDPNLAQLTLPTGEVVRPAAGFRAVATMNGVPRDLPLALRDRFPVTLEINDVHPDALATLPPDLQAVARQTTLVDRGTARVSIRVWQEFATLRESDGPELAAVACFGDRAQEVLDGLLVGSVVLS